MTQRYYDSRHLIKEINKFCKQYEMSPVSLATKVNYPGLIQRLQDGKPIKQITGERVLAQMELMKLKIELNRSFTIYQAVRAARKFLKTHDK